MTWYELKKKYSDHPDPNIRQLYRFGYFVGFTLVLCFTLLIVLLLLL